MPFLRRSLQFLVRVFLSLILCVYIHSGGIPSLLPVSCPGGSYSKLSCGTIFAVFTHIHSLMIDKDFCECWNTSVNFPCALLYVSFTWRTFHSISKSYLLSFLILCYRYISTFIFHMISRYYFY